jgi:hypothetical protein
MVAVPAPDGVKTPDELIVPFVAVQATVVLKLPVPATLGAQVDVWVIWMDPGVQVTETDVIDEDAFTATVADPSLEVSCVDVAVTVATPDPFDVNKPAAVTVPFVAVQVTAEL